MTEAQNKINDDYLVFEKWFTENYPFTYKGHKFEEAKGNAWEAYQHQQQRIDELEKKLAEVSKNSERYKIFKDNLFCADFLYGEDEISVLVFEWNHRVSADLDFTIDEALKQIEVK